MQPHPKEVVEQAQAVAAHPDRHPAETVAAARRIVDRHIHWLILLAEGAHSVKA